MKNIFIVVIVLVIVVAGAYFFLMRGESEVNIENAKIVPVSEVEDSTKINAVEPEKTTPNPVTTPASTPPPTPTQTPTPNPTPTPAPAPAPAPVTHNVSIQNFAFSQASLNIKKGDTVVWTNNDSAPHTATGINGGPASGTLNKGGTYSFTFNSSGTFNYKCAFHPSMTGSVTVQ